ncbi:hypothetical protein [Pseudomonas chlororaphis]|nr:hypothetical protein [Pseudomonas chlororaphis]
MDASQWTEKGDKAKAEQHRSMVKNAGQAGWVELASKLSPVLFEQEGLPITLP